MANQPEKFYETMARMEAGFLMCLQHDNRCRTTGKPCRRIDKCDCYLEMQHWCGVIPQLAKDETEKTNPFSWSRGPRV